jgi:hypothetical protein
VNDFRSVGNYVEKWCEEEDLVCETSESVIDGRKYVVHGSGISLQRETSFYTGRSLLGASSHPKKTRAQAESRSNV